MSRIAKFLATFSSRAAVFACIGSVLFACASQQSKRNDEREKLIPDSTQRESEQMQGEQQIFMGSLNQTTSEQAGVRHERQALPKRDPDEEKGNRNR